MGISFYEDTFIDARGLPKKRELFAFDPGDGKCIIGHVDEAIKKQHPAEYEAFLKGSKAPAEEVKKPAAKEAKITKTNNPTIEFKDEKK